MTREPTLDDAIEAIAAVEARDPDEFLVEDVLIDGMNWRYEPRYLTFRNSPRVIEEAKTLLRQHVLNREFYRIVSEKVAAAQIAAAE